MSAVVSSAAGGDGGHFLGRTGIELGVLSVVSHSPFLLFLVALLTAAAAIALWIEMLMRDAAVYIVVLMLPLAFAAMVWPARRVWAVRTAELLVALILSKFAIVAVLALGAAALGHSDGGGGMLIGLVLVTLAAFSPWALVRMLPLAELASGAAGHLRPEAARLGRAMDTSEGLALAGAEWAGTVVSGMRRQARDAADVGSGGGFGGPADDGAGSEAEKLAAGAATTNGGRPSSTDPAGDENRADDASASTTEPVTSATASLSGADRVRAERASNLPRPFDADDLSWSPIELGPELLSDGEIEVDAGGAAGAGANPAAADGGDRSSVGGEGLRSAGRGSGATPTPPGATRTPPGDGDRPPGEDSDPLPPEQDPEEGRL
jgi:hypothetical protein